MNGTASPSCPQSHDHLLDLARLDACRICPRLCGANRISGVRGVCGANNDVEIARAALHFWEEPPISGEVGSGTIFFSDCPLKCVFCQNSEISAGGFGKPVTLERLMQIMLELQEQHAANVNFVTPTHYAAHIRHALIGARTAGLTIPAVYNTSGYELTEAIRELEGHIQVWLPDFKYASSELARRYSKAADYPTRALAALHEMVRQVTAAGGPAYEDGLMRRGIIVRHLVLPGHAQDSMRVLDLLWENFANTIEVSIMNQFTPTEFLQGKAPELCRALEGDEYETVLDHADYLGFETVYWQEGGTVDESFIPAFDTTGVEVSALYSTGNEKRG